MLSQHVELYSRKGLLVKLQGVRGLAEWMAGPAGVQNASSASALESALAATLEEYNHAAAAGGGDGFGKKYFTNAPLPLDGVMYAGRIVPVLHYCMGGIRMDKHGAVLREDGSPLLGLHAAGEVSDGLAAVWRWPTTRTARASLCYPPLPAEAPLPLSAPRYQARRRCPLQATGGGAHGWSGVTWLPHDCCLACT